MSARHVTGVHRVAMDEAESKFEVAFPVDGGSVSLVFDKATLLRSVSDLNELVVYLEGKTLTNTGHYAIMEIPVMRAAATADASSQNASLRLQLQNGAMPTFGLRPEMARELARNLLAVADEIDRRGPLQ